MKGRGCAATCLGGLHAPPGVQHVSDLRGTCGSFTKKGGLLWRSISLLPTVACRSSPPPLPSRAVVSEQCRVPHGRTRAMLRRFRKHRFIGSRPIPSSARPNPGSCPGAPRLDFGLAIPGPSRRRHQCAYLAGPPWHAPKDRLQVGSRRRLRRRGCARHARYRRGLLCRQLLLGAGQARCAPPHCTPRVPSKFPEHRTFWGPDRPSALA